MSLDDNRVAVLDTGNTSYPANVPFDPPEAYPELPPGETEPGNRIYKGVRDTLRAIGLDSGNYGTPAWNPLGEIVKPGMTVFIKPNTVRHYHVGGGDVLSVIVHASVIRPMLDYITIALQGSGRIIIGDSQVTEGLFDEALEKAQIDKLLDWYRTISEIPIECYDLRINRSTRTWLYGKWGRKTIEQDPRGYSWVDLGEESCFRDVDPARLRIGISSYKEMYKHHSGGRHEYLFPNSFLASDVVINMPKLKTHRRTGVTIALKNFMGLPAFKDTLPHFTTGSPEEGGDQYIHPSARKRLVLKMHDVIQTSRFVPVKFVTAVAKKLLWNTRFIVPFKDDVYEAMWHGNDTVWRTLLDLNRAALYADKEGKLASTLQRGYFCLVDGIIAGEKDGPVSPDPVKAGVFIAGHNPVAVDLTAATLMGFDIDKIRLMYMAERDAAHSLPIFHGSRSDIRVSTAEGTYNLHEFGARFNLRFEPHPNWKGHIERE